MRTKGEEKQVRALVVCADGAATSTMVLVALREALEDRGIPAEIVQGRVLDAERLVKSEDFDFVVSTAGTEAIDVDIPVLSGVPFLTGIGKEQTLDKIMKIVDKKGGN